MPYDNALLGLEFTFNIFIDDVIPHPQEMLGIVFSLLMHQVLVGVSFAFHHLGLQVHDELFLEVIDVSAHDSQIGHVFFSVLCAVFFIHELVDSRYRLSLP